MRVSDPNLYTSISLQGVYILAGTGSINYLDGIASVSQFYYPSDAALDSAGNIFIVEYGNHLVRKISSAGVLSMKVFM